MHTTVYSSPLSSQGEGNFSQDKGTRTGHSVLILTARLPYQNSISLIIHCGFLLTFLGWKMRDCIATLVSSYLEKKFNSDVLISHTLPIAKVNEGFELLRAGKR